MRTNGLNILEGSDLTPIFAEKLLCVSVKERLIQTLKYMQRLQYSMSEQVTEDPVFGSVLTGINTVTTTPKRLPNCTITDLELIVVDATPSSVFTNGNTFCVAVTLDGSIPHKGFLLPVGAEQKEYPFEIISCFLCEKHAKCVQVPTFDTFGSNSYFYSESICSSCFDAFTDLEQQVAADVNKEEILIKLLG